MSSKRKGILYGVVLSAVAISIILLSYLMTAGNEADTEPEEAVVDSAVGP